MAIVEKIEILNHPSPSLKKKGPLKPPLPRRDGEPPLASYNVFFCKQTFTRPNEPLPTASTASGWGDLFFYFFGA